MNINKVCSDLEFVNCAITKLEVSNNLIAILPDDSFDIKLKFLPYFGTNSSDEYHGRLEISLSVVVSRDDVDDSTAEIELDMDGFFAAPKDSMSEEEFKSMVALNGGAALYGIARGKVEGISSMIFADGKIVLPFVNVMEYYKQAESADTDSKKRGTRKKK